MLYYNPGYMSGDSYNGLGPISPIKPSDSGLVGLKNPGYNQIITAADVKKAMPSIGLAVAAAGGLFQDHNAGRNDPIIPMFGQQATPQQPSIAQYFGMSPNFGMSNNFGMSLLGKG